MKKAGRVALLLVLSVVSRETYAARSPMSVDSIIARRMHARSIPVVDSNSVRFFYTGHDKFVDLFDAVRNARSSIHLEYFNFRNDSIAGLLFQLLAQKAAEGVEVRAMYDDFGNRSNNSPISRAMHDSICATGVRLVRFDPIKFPWVNHIIPRDHRKIVVIDGQIAYTGGMNVADYYIKGIPGIGDWHDMHMRIEGPVVREIQTVFCRMWRKSTGESLLDNDKYFPALKPAGNCRMSFVDRHSGKTSDVMRDLYVTMIDAAHHSIKIINPYFVPTHRVRKALKRAIDRGVKVEILVSARGDIPLTPQTAHYVSNNYMKRGATVYLFEGGFHHTKMMIVDDICCTVGSVNLDSRSLRCDYEANMLILDKQATDELVAHFEEQKKHSFLMYKGWYREQSFGHRFQGWFGNLLTPFL